VNPIQMPSSEEVVPVEFCRGRCERGAAKPSRECFRSAFDQIGNCWSATSVEPEVCFRSLTALVIRSAPAPFLLLITRDPGGTKPANGGWRQ
jgi:hypothetical protein